MPNKPKILFISYECSPFIKLGGLGDVALGLPKAVKKLGADIRVALPLYSQIDQKKFKIKKTKEKLTVEFGHKDYEVQIYESKLPGSSVPIYFFYNKHFFERKDIFGELGREKFLFFQQAILEYVKKGKWQPSVLHCNDWQTGMLPLMIKDEAQLDLFYKNIKTLYTIHNLAYQGDADPKILQNIELDIYEYYSLANDFLQDGDIDYMYQGVAHADLINTVSPTYAKEILSPEYGSRLEDLLSKRKNDLSGIINGLDQDDWDPKKDKSLSFNLKNDLSEYKKKNKEYLQKQLKLPVDSSIPIVSIISRLAGQKGLDLVLDWLQKNKDKNFQFVLLGTGDKKLEKDFAALEKKNPKNIKAVIGFDIKLARQIYAGSDMFLMPSKYEPCGLGQMISMRYGTVPIVRETGGLKDSVSNYPKKEKNKGFGFIFETFDSKNLTKAINSGLKNYKNTNQWKKMVEYNYKTDFSWKQPAKDYLKLYNKLLNK